jgi:hypothetical protein
MSEKLLKPIELQDKNKDEEHGHGHGHGFETGRDKNSGKDKKLFEVNILEGVEERDPLELKRLSLPADYYSLTWTALKKSQFLGAKFHGIDIYLLPSDFFWIYINFLFFFIFIFLSIILLIKEALMDDVYVDAGVEMYILRVIIVAFCQRLILPEFTQGYYKLIYSLQKKKEFTHPGFANFVALCQMFVSVSALTAIIFFVCMADEYIDPITNCSGLCVLNELDDWIGDAIMSHKLDGLEAVDRKTREENYAKIKVEFEHNPAEHEHEVAKSDGEFDLDMINERLPLVNKLALVEDDDLIIDIDDRIELNTYVVIVYIEKIVSLLPWDKIIPLLTIPIGMYMPTITSYIR